MIPIPSKSKNRTKECIIKGRGSDALASKKEKKKLYPYVYTTTADDDSAVPSFTSSSAIRIFNSAAFIYLRL